MCKNKKVSINCIDFCFKKRNMVEKRLFILNFDILHVSSQSQDGSELTFFLQSSK